VSTGNDDLDAWKRQRTVSLALELADSGRYEDFTDIAYALQFEHGMAHAQSFIDDADMRRTLNRRCADAREALEPVASPAVCAVAEVMAEPAAEAVRESVIGEPPPLPAFSHSAGLFRRLAGALKRSGASPADLETAS
jgi:hypothetical protein